MFILRKSSPPKTPFSAFSSHVLCLFSAKYCAFRPKTIGFALQFLTFYQSKRHPFGCKTIGIAMQNDRFCIATPHDFLHTMRYFGFNPHVINHLSLHTHTC